MKGSNHPNMDTFIKKWTCGFGTETVATTTETTMTTTTATVPPLIYKPVKRIPKNLVCNKYRQMDRIAGGTEAFRNTWPWIAFLKFGTKRCGGTILNEKTIITAAHCCLGFTSRPDLVTGTF